jgi:hypothetical protein
VRIEWWDVPIFIVKWVARMTWIKTDPRAANQTWAASLEMRYYLEILDVAEAGYENHIYIMITLDKNQKERRRTWKGSCTWPWRILDGRMHFGIE